MSAYIVTAVRSAVGKVGKNGGALSNVHSVDLGGQILDQLVINTPSLDPADVDDVIFGCVTQIGENAGNLARQCILSSTQLPITVPGTTVDRQCGSSQQAVHFAAQAVMSGTQDIVIAGGVESMGRVPMFSNFAKGKFGNPNNSKIQEKFGTDQSFFSQFVGAEMMGVKFCISRSDMDSFAAYSHEKATIAQANGVFKDEIVPIDVGDGTFHTIDEGVRPGTTAEKLSTLKTLVEAGMAQPVEGGDANGSITAGNASQMSDGGSAILVVNDAGLKKLGGSVTPLAMIRNLSLAASDPILMLSAPIPATQKLLKTAGLTINDIDGSITAGNASQMSDGGSAILVVNDAGLKKLGGSVTPLAMIRNLSLAASDPILMLSAPIPATQKLLKTAGLTINDIDRYASQRASCKRSELVTTSVWCYWLASLAARFARSSLRSQALRKTRR